MSFTHLQTTWHHLRRSPYQSFATLIVITLNLALITLFLLVAGGAESTLRALESQPQVIAFFTEPPTELELEQLNAQLAQTQQIKMITYVSPTEALEKYKQDNQDNPLLLEMVTADILPASIEVSTTTPKSLAQVADMLNLHEKIDEVIYQKDVIDELVKWTKFLRIFGIILVSTLSVAAFLTIFVIISEKISLRRKEVEILKLLGATSMYIQWPFIIEGWIYGAIGAALGWGITYLGILYSTPYMIDLLWRLGLIPISAYWMFYLLALEVFTAGIWCALASTWAVNRYLRRF